MEGHTQACQKLCHLRKQGHILCAWRCSGVSKVGLPFCEGKHWQNRNWHREVSAAVPCLKMGKHEHLRHSQAELSSIGGKVSWRERQSRKWPKATREQQGNCKSSGKQKEANPGMRDQWGIWKVVTLLPCSCYHPQITAASGSPNLSESSFLVVHPISIPSTLPSPHMVAWFSHSPLQWQNALGHLDFGSVISSGLPLLSLLKSPVFPHFSGMGAPADVSLPIQTSVAEVQKKQPERTPSPVQAGTFLFDISQKMFWRIGIKYF